MSRKLFLSGSLSCLAICLVAIGAAAQTQNPRSSLGCNNGNTYYDDARARHCEVKEQTIAAIGETVNVDGMQNGGISLKGWNRNDILVRYRVQTQVPTQAEADSIASQIRVTTTGGQIRAEGPAQIRDANWNVSYEVFVPHRSDVSLRTHNGGISITDVSGRISFEAQNGGVALRSLGGNVSGETVNGGLSIELTGNNWDGEGLNAKTTNGGLSVSVPDNYSAHLETGTVNGHLAVSPSIADITRETRQLALNLGGGGTSLRIFTTNGGVSIRRREAH
ncbi:MAG: hypothetical protein QOJ64_2522 [Acidobacteriota bacterium]|nr:hypothetical protein [Acidobacteriota bacterium]